MATKKKFDSEGVEPQVAQEPHEVTGSEKFEYVNGYVLENKDKIDRVIFGEVKRAGVPEGGLGEDADPMLVLAHYDKLAGYITKDGVKIKTGSFWDFRNKRPHETPKVLYMFRIGGETVEVDDPANLHKAVNVLQTALAKKEAEVKRKKSNSKFKQDKAE